MKELMNIVYRIPGHLGSVDGSIMILDYKAKRCDCNVINNICQADFLIGK